MTSVSIGLNIGESFADFVGLAGAEPMAPQRFYLPRRSLTDCLKEYLGPHFATGGTVTVATSLASYALAKGLGSPPAFLVTTGFEPWLTLQQPLSSVTRLFPERMALPVGDDHVFGISERIRADGSIEQELATEDLEFLSAKLELLKTRTISVGLLHSNRNDKHEKAIRDFFVARGFRIYCSHTFSGNEWERWEKAVAAAYAWNAVCEQKQQIESVFAETTNWSLRFLESKEAKLNIDSEPGSGSELGGPQALLEVSGATQILHLGIERFFWLQKGKCPRVLKIQPNTAIQRTAWPFAVFGETPAGFEPGPMAFGKAQQPTAFDLLFVLDRLETMEAITPLLNEKTRPRILETLYTLSKDIPSKSRIEATTVAKDLATSFLERLQQDSLLFADPSQPILLTGTLARTLHPHLEKRRPDLKFKLAPDADFAVAIAVNRFGGQMESAK